MGSKHNDMRPIVPVFALLVVVSLGAPQRPQQPHIVWLTVDDLGWCDFAWTGSGSDVLSPTLSKLAAEGTVLNNYYVNPICTPTRASFMTGRYPIHLGLQHGVIIDSVAEAVPINETMVQAHLKVEGYRTHIVGKWHLGFHQKRFTPEARGFDTHFGYYTGNEEYWNHTSPCWGCGNYTALDLHHATANSFEPITNASMKYSTELFSEQMVQIVEQHPVSEPLFLYAPLEAVHGASSCFVAGKSPDCNAPDGDELQAPDRFIEQQKHIVSPYRRTFAGMLGAVDEAVSNLTSALQAKGMLDNTVLLVTTDNGAPYTHFNEAAMSNYPLRGGKGSLWEGGIRAAGFLWGKGIPAGVNNTKLFHAADWLPTLVALAGGKLTEKHARSLDGHDIWSAITADVPSPRREILHNIDPLKKEAAIRVGDWKLIVGASNKGWGPKPGTKGLTRDIVGPEKESGPWLFNMRDDPTERTNFYGEPLYAEQQGELERALQRYNVSAVPCRLCYAKPDRKAAPPVVPGLEICTPAPVDESDPAQGSGPILCSDVGVWQPWQDDDGSNLWHS